MNATKTRLGLAAVATLSALWSAPLLARSGKKAPRQQSHYTAFEDEKPAAEMAPEDVGGGPLAALGTTPSLPLQIAVEGDEALPLRQIPPNAGAGSGASRSLSLGDCVVELTTGALSVSTHELYPDGKFYVESDGVLKGATLRYDPGTMIYLQVAADLKAKVLGDAAMQKACEKQLRKGGMPLGTVTLAGTRVGAKAGEGRGRAMFFREAKGAEAHAIFLVWDPAEGGVAARDEGGMPVVAESAIFGAKAEGLGYWDLEVAADLALDARHAAAAAGKTAAAPAPAALSK